MVKVNRNYFRKSTIAKWITKLLVSLKDDPNRDGLSETPERLAKIWMNMLVGNRYTDEELLEMFNQTMPTVSRESISFNTFTVTAVSELNLFPYKLDITIKYVPMKKIIDISTVQELVAMCAKRLRTPTSLGEDIYRLLSKILETKDISLKMIAHCFEGDISTNISRGIYGHEKEVF